MCHQQQYLVKSSSSSGPNLRAAATMSNTCCSAPPFIFSKRLLFFSTMSIILTFLGLMNSINFCRQVSSPQNEMIGVWTQAGRPHPLHTSCGTTRRPSQSMHISRRRALDPGLMAPVKLTSQPVPWQSGQGTTGWIYDSPTHPPSAFRIFPTDCPPDASFSLGRRDFLLHTLRRLTAFLARTRLPLVSTRTF